MDAGEPGLPGVRVVTLNGVLITTDSEGRFHVPCVAIPDASIGSNFLMKLDTRTLPTGYEMTTENPRDVRITRGKVTEINFGAAITHEVRVDVTGKAFDRTDLTSKWATGIDRLFDILCHEHSTLLFVYHRGGESKALAESRLATLEDTMRFAWKNGQCGYKLKISSRVEDGK
jgi:large repetitive protein